MSASGVVIIAVEAQDLPNTPKLQAPLTEISHINLATLAASRIWRSLRLPGSCSYPGASQALQRHGSQSLQVSVRAELERLCRASVGSSQTGIIFHTMLKVSQNKQSVSRWEPGLFAVACARVERAKCFCLICTSFHSRDDFILSNPEAVLAESSAGVAAHALVHRAVSLVPSSSMGLGDSAKELPYWLTAWGDRVGDPHCLGRPPIASTPGLVL